MPFDINAAIPLLKKYRAEIPHIEHVTSLALKIFDDIKKELYLPEKYRKILKAAALLHDIGYTAGPLRHPEHSRDIVKKESIAGVSGPEKEACLEIILRHGKNSPPLSGTQREVKDKKILICSGILRIADGLDHSHIQDCRLKKITIENRRMKFELSENVYKGNISAASRKGRLLKKVCGLETDFWDLTKRRSYFPYSHLIKKDIPVSEALRKILFFHYRTMTENMGEKLYKGNDTKPLHDFRVASRRFLTVLKTYKKFLPESEARKAKQSLKYIYKNLGKPRDYDVKYSYFNSIKNSGENTYPQFRDFLHKLESERNNSKEKLEKTVKSDEFIKMIKSILWLLRVALPHSTKDREKTFNSLFSKTAGKKIRRLYGYNPEDFSENPEKMHSLRKKFRKARYISELYTGIRTEKYLKQVKKIKKLTGLLGDIHDRDVFLKYYKKKTGLSKNKLTDKIKSERSQTVREFISGYEKFIL
ncbi:MAG: CHAD domain-containing protein [Fibrobacterota bacterium]